MNNYISTPFVTPCRNCKTLVYEKWFGWCANCYCPHHGDLKYTGCYCEVCKLEISCSCLRKGLMYNICENCYVKCDCMENCREHSNSHCLVCGINRIFGQHKLCQSCKLIKKCICGRCDSTNIIYYYDAVRDVIGCNNCFICPQCHAIQTRDNRCASGGNLCSSCCDCVTCVKQLPRLSAQYIALTLTLRDLRIKVPRVLIYHIFNFAQGAK